MKVVTVKRIIPGPFVKWYRNPIWWWTMRHLRHDLDYLERQRAVVGATFERELNDHMDAAFLFGDGGQL